MRKRLLKVLELDPDASFEEVERAYKELIRVWHPDRFQSDPVLRAKAEEKTRELNYVYAELLRITPPEARQVALLETSRVNLKWPFVAIVAIFLIFIALKNRYLSERVFGNSQFEQEQFFSLRKSINESVDRKKQDSEASIKRIEDGSSTIRTPFMKAAIDCNISEFEKMLSQGHDIDEKDGNGNSALIWASRQGCQQIVKILISRGVDVNRKSGNGFSPLMWASLYNRKEIEKILLDAGSEPLPKFWNKNH